MKKGKKTDYCARVYLDPDEEARARELSEQASISIAELFRRLLAGESQDVSLLQREQRFQDLLEAIGEMRHFRSDLARLGNLLKLAIDDDSWADDERQVNRVWELVKDLAGKREDMDKILESTRAKALAISGKG